jgi:flagellar assembly protein FliH
MDFVEGFGAKAKEKREDTIQMKSILKKDDAFGAIKFEDLSNKNTEARSEVDRLKREMEALKSSHAAEKKQWLEERNKIKEKQKSELEAAVSKASEDSLDQGKTAAEAEHKAREEEVFKQLYSAMEAIEQEKKMFFETAENGMIKILSTMSRQIVGSWLDEHPDAIERSVKEVLSFIGNEKNVKLLLNSEDFAWVQPRIKNWLDIGQSQLEIDILEENRIHRGGCILETASGNVEVRLDELFADMDSIILKHFKSE